MATKHLLSFPRQQASLDAASAQLQARPEPSSVVVNIWYALLVCSQCKVFHFNWNGSRSAEKWSSPALIQCSHIVYASQLSRACRRFPFSLQLHTFEPSWARKPHLRSTKKKGELNAKKAKSLPVAEDFSRPWKSFLISTDVPIQIFSLSLCVALCDVLFIPRGPKISVYVWDDEKIEWNWL